LPPCRVLDIRGNGAPFQGGILTGGSDVRNYVIPPICGVPTGVSAVSLNFTVTGPGQTTARFLLAWPTGGAVPTVSILNWDRPQPALCSRRADIEDAVVPRAGAAALAHRDGHLQRWRNGQHGDGGAAGLGEDVEGSGGAGEAAAANVVSARAAIMGENE